MGEIKAKLNTGGTRKNGEIRTFIIQEYIDKPLLFKKRKFDFRCFLLLTSVNGCLKAYWYEEGYIRTSCVDFSTRKLDNKYIHLTNDAVQKHCQDYGKFENGNKISFIEFEKFCDSNQIDFHEKLLEKMKDLASHAIKSVIGKIDP